MSYKAIKHGFGFMVFVLLEYLSVYWCKSAIVVTFSFFSTMVFNDWEERL